MDRDELVGVQSGLTATKSCMTTSPINQYQIPRSVEAGKCAPVFLEEGLYMSFIAKHPTNDLLYII